MNLATMIINLIPKSSPKCGFLSFFTLAPTFHTKQCKCKHDNNKNGLKRKANPFSLLFSTLCLTCSNSHHVVSLAAQLLPCLIWPMRKPSGQVTCARFRREVAGLGLRAGLSRSKGHPEAIRYQTQGERAGLFKEGRQSKKMERTWVLDGRLNSEELPTSMLLIRQGNQCLSLTPLFIGSSTICG